MSLCLGQTAPDPIGEYLGTGYGRFESPHGVCGLAKEEGARVDILAVVASAPGKGHFRAFIRHLQTHCGTVCVWEDWNPLIGDALARYGFRPSVTRDQFGKFVHGWRWDR